MKLKNKPLTLIIIKLSVALIADMALVSSLTMFMMIRANIYIIPTIVITLLLLINIFLSYYFYRKLVAKPLEEMETVFNRFVNCEIYQELLDRSGYYSPALGKTFKRFDRMLDRQKTLELSTKQAEFLALQQQINPHFLYNTLEAIRGDALCAGSNDIANIAEALSTYFQYTVTKTGNLVFLEDELENVENYFIIQQYRFGDKCKMIIDILEEDSDVRLIQCPKLMLQPIVENAIFHGIEKRKEGGTVSISIRKSAGIINISISDDGTGIDENKLDEINDELAKVSFSYIPDSRKDRGGIALYNVCRRIKLLFGEEYGIHIYSTINVGTDVIIKLPLTYTSAG